MARIDMAARKKTPPEIAAAELKTAVKRNESLSHGLY